MKKLKYILMGIAVLAVLLPSPHALEHHDHGHDSALELCALDALPCECHSCDHPSCSSNIETQLDQSSGSYSLEILRHVAPQFALPQDKPVLRNIPPTVVGILASLQTVQLLI